MDQLTKIKVAGITEGFDERSFTMEDVTLNYVVGPDNGLPLLLIPGQMESWQGYKCVLPALSQDFHVFVPDLRGHGKSTHTPGRYSYNICGNDLKRFIHEVIQKPTLVAGLSSGGVLAIWLGANLPEDILAIIAEDPPIFSSIWPRIRDEKLLNRNFRAAVDILAKPGKRDVQAFLAQGGMPVEGKEELLQIPSFILKAMFFLSRINQALRPNMPYDTPLLPYHLRAGHKFLSEYDTDFSRATVDGDLSKDFSPEEALKQIRCPMLLMWADAYRHETWGLVGAIDDDDLARMIELVNDFRYIQIPGGHEIHMLKPQRYIDEIMGFIAELRQDGKLP